MHHIETSLLICKANQITGFYTTRAPTARYFRTNYNTMKETFKEIKCFEKKLDIRDFYSYLLPPVFRKIRRFQYTPYTVYRQLLGSQPLISFLKFSRFSVFIYFSGSISDIFALSMIYFQSHDMQSQYWTRKLRNLS